MSQNLEENRRQWPKETDNFTVSSKDVNPKKIWEPKSDYDAGGKYHKVRATTFRSGQSFEIDETPGGERMRLINTDGSYIELQHDGTFVHRSQGDSDEVVIKDKNVRVKGNLNVYIDGDANAKFGGDVFAEVGGALNATVKGKADVRVSGLTTLEFEGGTELKTPFLRITGDEVSHNGINIGDTHVHKDVMPGGGVSGVPLPI